MFERAIWDKLPEYIFKNFEISRVKRAQFQTFQKREGDLSQKLPKTNMWLPVNHRVIAK